MALSDYVSRTAGNYFPDCNSLLKIVIFDFLFVGLAKEQTAPNFPDFI